MSISPRLSRQLDQALGKEAAEELVNWMHDMDAHRAEARETMRADIAELRQEMQAGFARSDAKLAELRQEMQAGFARSDAKLAEFHEEMRMGFAAQREAMAHLETRLERRIGDLIKWSFVFWVGAVGAVAVLAGVLG